MTAVRAQVADSWVRSAAAGVEADRVDAPITLAQDVLRDHRQAHPLAQVFPLLDDVLGRAARECDAIMAVSDAAGQLLWVCGTPSVLRRAESIGFVEGSNWDERLAGTNAPGMALALGPAGQHHRRRALPPLGPALELRGDPDPRPATAALLGRPRHHRRRADRRAADDGDGAGGRPDGRGRARPRAAQPRQPEPPAPDRRAGSPSGCTASVATTRC